MTTSVQMNNQEFEGARIYCARGTHRYGFGFSEWRALEAANIQPGEIATVVRLPEDAYQPAVDMMGTLYWKGGTGEAEDCGKYTAESDEDCQEPIIEYEKVAT